MVFSGSQKNNEPAFPDHPDLTITKKRLAALPDEVRKDLTTLVTGREKDRKLIKRLEDLSTVDVLTNAPARRALEARADELIGDFLRTKYHEHEARRRNGNTPDYTDPPPLASDTVLHIDLDYFKFINSRLGEQPGGDEALKHLATVVRKSLERPTDFFARLGGDEFVIILRNTDEQQSRQYLGKLRQALAESPCEIPSEELKGTKYMESMAGKPVPAVVRVPLSITCGMHEITNAEKQHIFDNPILDKDLGDSTKVIFEDILKKCASAKDKERPERAEYVNTMHQQFNNGQVWVDDRFAASEKPGPDEPHRESSYRS